MALFSLLALLFLSIFPTSSFALTEFQALQVVKNFAEAFIYPNNIAIAKSINRWVVPLNLRLEVRIGLSWVVHCLQKMLLGLRMVSLPPYRIE